jgi:hypothetical protein
VCVCVCVCVCVVHLCSSVMARLYLFSYVPALSLFLILFWVHLFWVHQDFCAQNDELLGSASCFVALHPDQVLLRHLLLFYIFSPPFFIGPGPDTHLRTHTHPPTPTPTHTHTHPHPHTHTHAHTA